MPDPSHYERIIDAPAKAACEALKKRLTGPEMAKAREESQSYLAAEMSRRGKPAKIADLSWGMAAFNVVSGSFGFDARRYMASNPLIALMAAMWARAQEYADGVFDWEGVMNDPAMAAYFTAEAAFLIDAGVPADAVTLYQQERNFQMRVAATMLCFEEKGKQTFRVSDGLAQRFLLTELKGVHGDDVRLPYPSMYIEVPKILDFKLTNVHTHEHPLRGVYVTEVRSPDRDLRALSILLYGTPNQYSVATSDDALEYFDIVLGKTLVLDEVERMINKALTIEDDPALRRDATRWAEVVNWVLNVVFYTTLPYAEMVLTSDNKDFADLQRRALAAPKGSQKRKDLYARMRAMPQNSRIMLGGSIVLDRSLPHTADAARQATSVRQGGSRQTRLLVKGHYQSYWTGKGRTTREIRFREPFWVGPAGAPVRTPEHELRRAPDDEPEAE